ncbi:ABC transporter ATP-binding protein [Amnibacterium kyonggiense]|uniref:Energy-coupling factor transport system ATP-binding protein n=1 Tax=Amnibacterium kyonggiense TaxID=595671 RepID=A0A4R7FT38_9MICO|nr:ABC transporter ATP-binding protein [Amnibacterium kyonggiense]TDS81033.1 energy-coupling factor transport system ATP-binding protein [Amnibacterium kyonggiense]
MRPAALRAEGWGWQHAGRREWAVRGLDLRIEPGERILLLGPSGAGKSTLLKAFAGVLGDDEGDGAGRLLVDDQDAGAARGRVGLVLQAPDANIVLERVGDDVAFGCENLGVPATEIPGRVARATAAVGLLVPQDRSTAALSGGQQQRLAVAGVLAMGAGAVLLDEPTANLDPRGVPEVRDAVLAATAGATLVVVEHRVDVWRDHVDRIVVLEPGGGVLAQGPPDRVLREQGSALAAAGVWIPGFVPRAARSPRPGGAPLLAAEALAVGRDGAAVARGIDATARAGGALAVLGPNGVGKSTFALTAAGLLPRVAGRLEALPALADGLRADPIRWRSRELLPRIGCVFQQPEHQFVAPTVRQELAVGPRALRLGEQAVSDRTTEMLETLRLGALADANPFTLSGGEQRRLSVATALATAPKVLVVDEPTFGQDALTWAGLVDLFGRLLDEASSVLAVTHDERFADALGADRLVLA